MPKFSQVSQNSPSQKSSLCFVLSLLLLWLLTACGQASNQAGTIATSAPKTLPTPTNTSNTTYVSPDHNVNVTAIHDRIYAATFDQDVYALNSANGSQIWHNKIVGQAEEPPVVSANTVYISSFVGQNGPAYLTAFRANDGTRLWSYQSNSYIYQPVEQNGVVYLSQQQDGVTALHAQNGQQIWHFAGTTEQPPTLSNTLLYIASGQSTQPDGIYALHISDGSIAWHQPASANTTLTLHDGLLYLCCTAGSFSALHATTGQALWKQTIDTTFIQPPQFVDTTLYFLATKISLGTPVAHTLPLLPQALALSSLLIPNPQASTNQPLKEGQSSLYALQMSDGKVLWQKPLSKGNNDFGGFFQVDTDNIYTGLIEEGQANTTGLITALQRSNGKELWHKTISGNPSNLSLNNGIIYSIGNAWKSTLYALNAQTGTQLWSYPLAGSNTYNQPSISLSTIFIGESNGLIHAVQASNGKLLWRYQTRITA